jgi:hypothetical protein
VPIYFYTGAYYALIQSEARIIYVSLYVRNAAQTGCLPIMSARKMIEPPSNPTLVGI